MFIKQFLKKIKNMFYKIFNQDYKFKTHLIIKNYA